MNTNRNVARIVVGVVLLILALGFAGDGSIRTQNLLYGAVSALLVTIGITGGSALVYAGIKSMVRRRN